MKKILLLPLFIASFGVIACAQNITGSWEGIMSGEYLKINIVQEGNMLCGYTSDKVILNKDSYCKAYFKGKYNSATGVWTITGYKFIENSGDHILMTLKLWSIYNNNKNILRGSVSAANSLFDDGEYFTVKKVSDVPQKISSRMPICYENIPSTTIKKTPPPKKENEKQNKITPPPVSKKRDDPKKKEDPIKKDSIAKDNIVEKNQTNANEEMLKREKGNFSTIKVKSIHIEIKIYDNGEIDNDTISLFYNNRILLENQRISQNPLIAYIDLDENSPQHEITLFAVNLGRIPPNTALMVISDGKRKIELNPSANLGKNATITVIYEP